MVWYIIIWLYFEKLFLFSKHYAAKSMLRKLWHLIHVINNSKLQEKIHPNNQSFYVQRIVDNDWELLQLVDVLFLSVEQLR